MLTLECIGFMHRIHMSVPPDLPVTLKERITKVHKILSDDHPFIRACEVGDVEVAEYLYNSSKANRRPTIDIHANTEEAYYVAHKNNRENVMTWLLKVAEDEGRPYDLSGLTRWASHHSIRRGHRNIAEWLHDLNTPIVIRPEVEPLFINAVANNRIELINYIIAHDVR